MKKILSIGEMSKLHNITVQTLRYYDEMGLLVPVQIDEKSGYRYYSTDQFEQLNTINYLKGLGFSLKEIKAHLEHRDIDGFVKLLQQQQEITASKIRELQRIYTKFQHRIEEIQRAQSIKELGVVLLQEFSMRRIFRLKEGITSEPDLEIALRRLENMSNIKSSIFIGGVGLTVAIENVRKGRFSEYNSIFLFTEDESAQSEYITTFPEGLYACIYFKGHRTASTSYYNILLEDIHNKGLRIAGDSIERTLINQYISRNPEDHITEIQIPVK